MIEAHVNIQIHMQGSIEELTQMGSYKHKEWTVEKGEINTVELKARKLENIVSNVVNDLIKESKE